MSGIDNHITKEDSGSVFYAAAQTLRRYVSGGNMLFIATVLALVAANLPVVRDFYAGFWEKVCAFRLASSMFSAIRDVR